MAVSADLDAASAAGPEIGSAEATLKQLPYYRANFRKIIELRERTTEQLAALGFQTLPSATNFILTKPPRFAARTWLKRLRERKILVRWFTDTRVKDYLRITIGSEREMAALLRAVKAILKG